jgi:hypothetical protein
MASGVTQSTGSATAVGRLGCEPKRPQRAREVGLHGLQSPLEIAVAQCFGNAAMLVKDRRHPLAVVDQ